MKWKILIVAIGLILLASAQWGVPLWFPAVSETILKVASIVISYLVFIFVCSVDLKGLDADAAGRRKRREIIFNMALFTVICLLFVVMGLI